MSHANGSYYVPHGTRWPIIGSAHMNNKSAAIKPAKSSNAYFLGNLTQVIASAFTSP